MKLLLTSTHRAPFIEDDLLLLRKHYEVEHVQTRGVGSLGKIVQAVRRNDLTFTWFASVYAAMVVRCTKQWNKKSIVVVGGVDVANHPEIGYGIWRSPWKARLVRYALRHADRVLVVDPSLQTRAITLAGYDGSNIRYVPTGFDPERWRPGAAKEGFVLTVAKCENRVRLRVKGVPFLMEAAKQLPHVHFRIVGIAERLLAELRATASPNVELLPLVTRDQLVAQYQRAAVYCQPSYSEGLPNSLCEAMLCECVPVGTSVGGIPTALRSAGFLVPYGDVQALTDAITQALHAPSSVGQAARRFIAENFTLARREQDLLHTLEEVME